MVARLAGATEASRAHSLGSKDETNDLELCEDAHGYSPVLAAHGDGRRMRVAQHIGDTRAGGSCSGISCGIGISRGRTNGGDD